MSITNSAGITDNIHEEQQEPQFQPKPLVQEGDFPQKSSRLQKIIAQYCNSNNAAAPVEGFTPSPQIILKPDDKSKSFDSLTPKDQQLVLARIVDYTSSVNILNFGSAKGSELTKHAEAIIAKYTAQDIGEIADPMAELVAIIESDDVAAIAKNIGGKGTSDSDGEWQFFASLRDYLRLRRVRRKIEKCLAQRRTISKNLKELEIRLEQNKLGLQKDIEVYEGMQKATWEQIKDFILDDVALGLMMDDAQHRMDDIVNAASRVSNGNESVLALDQENYYERENLKLGIERMQRRRKSILSVRASTAETLPMLSGIIQGDEILCEKISEVITLIIPMWSWQYAIAIGAVKQLEVLNITKAIRDVTSKLLTGNAKMVHDNMIAAQEELYTAAVAIEDLQIVYDYMADMVAAVKTKKAEAAAKTVEEMKSMVALEQRTYELLSQTA